MEDLIIHNLEELRQIKESILGDVANIEDLLAKVAEKAKELRSLSEFIQVLDDQIAKFHNDRCMTYCISCYCGEKIMPIAIKYINSHVEVTYADKCPKCRRILKHEIN